MKKILNKKLLNDYFIKHRMDTIFGTDVTEHALLLSFDKNELILAAGSELEYYYLLVEGKVRIAYPFENGKAMLLKFYSGFNVIGDLELLKNMPVRCDVEAAAESVLIAIPIPVIRENCMENPEFLRHLADSLSEKLDSTISNSSYNVIYPLTNRLASYLTEYITETGPILLSATFQEIAQFLGTSYRHLSRTMVELEKQGIIRCEGRTIHVLDESRLRRLSKNPYKKSR